MGLFNNYNKIEKELLELYSQMFINMGIPDGQKTAKDMLDQSIEESKKMGHYNLSPNIGDMLLEKEKITGNINQNFERKRREEGVRDEDIRWWFNLNDVERIMMLKVDEFHRLSLFFAMTEEGKTKEEADRIVRKNHPIYGDLNDERFVKGDDKPLSLELKDRINIYINKRASNDQDKFRKETEESSTFNALVRKEIKAGNI